MNQQWADKLENARVNATNANNLVQSLRQQVQTLTANLNTQGQYVSHLEGMLHAMEQRVQALEDTLAGE